MKSCDFQHSTVWGSGGPGPGVGWGRTTVRCLIERTAQIRPRPDRVEHRWTQSSFCWTKYLLRWTKKSPWPDRIQNSTLFYLAPYCTNPGMAFSPLMRATYILGNSTAVWQCVCIDRPMPLAERDELAWPGGRIPFDLLMKKYSVCFELDWNWRSHPS